MEFKGSRTEANLMAAFSGEAMAESRYNFYAQAARSEGLLPAAEIFEETARNDFGYVREGEIHFHFASMDVLRGYTEAEWNALLDEFRD